MKDLRYSKISTDIEFATSHLIKILLVPANSKTKSQNLQKSTKQRGWSSGPIHTKFAVSATRFTYSTHAFAVHEALIRRHASANPGGRIFRRITTRAVWDSRSSYDYHGIRIRSGPEHVNANEPHGIRSNLRPLTSPDTDREALTIFPRRTDFLRGDSTPMLSRHTSYRLSVTSEDRSSRSVHAGTLESRKCWRTGKFN